MIDIEFVDELPGGRVGPNRDPVAKDFAAALKDRPGAWAKWPTTLTRSSAYSYATRIHKGAIKPLALGFEAAVRKGQLYVRFVGDGGAQ
ncbi:MAG: hypothetical protein ACRDXB_20045 [Actinomycetes bacterium]